MGNTAGKKRQNKLCLKEQKHVTTEEILNKIEIAQETNILDLQQCSLHVIPPELLQLTELTTLNLSDNSLEDLRNLQQLVGLCNIKLNNNPKINSLPDFALLNNLELTDIGKCQMLTFPIALCTLPNLSRLILHCNRFENIPDEIGMLTTLKVLDLSTNKLQTLPADIGKLAALKNLDLDSNRLRSLPKEFGDLQNLTELSCANNNFGAFPDSIYRLTFVNTLDFQRNRISQLSSKIEDMQSLKKLNLAQNNFSEFPKAISNLKGLTDLDLSKNVISKISGVIKNMAELCNLKLSENKLYRLPPEIGELTVLMELELTKNKLEKLPPSIGNLQYLGKLLLSQNRLRSIPVECKGFQFLEELDISHNKITALPEEVIVALERVKTLNLASNRLKNLPDCSGLKRVTALNFSHNYIEEFPAGFHTLTRLVALSCISNRVRELPEGIAKLVNLETCDLADNKLGDAGLVCLCREGSNLPVLERLSISGNKLNSLPENLCQNLPVLREFFAGRNSIATIPDGISTLSKLRILDLSHNSISSVPGSVGKLPILRELNLSGNGLTYLPLEFGHLTTLHTLYLDHNSFDQLPIVLEKIKDTCYQLVHDIPPSIALNSTVVIAQPRKIPAHIGVSETIGKRPRMEDAVTYQVGMCSHENVDAFAVFDGHAGRETAFFAADKFGKILERLLSDFKPKKIQQSATSLDSKKYFSSARETETAEKILAKVFTELDEQVSSLPDGATAVSALLHDNILYVANVGDARAVLMRKNEAIPLTRDHTPALPAEEERIRKLDGYVVSNRVQGILAVSRSLGDNRLKPYVSAVPEVRQTKLSHADQFLILACDGCWDVLSNQQACDIVRREMASSSNVQKAASKLKEQAFFLGSTDNISVMVIDLSKYRPHSRRSSRSKQSRSGHHRIRSRRRTDLRRSPLHRRSSSGKANERRRKSRQRTSSALRSRSEVRRNKVSPRETNEEKTEEKKEKETSATEKLFPFLKGSRSRSRSWEKIINRGRSASADCTLKSASLLFSGGHSLARTRAQSAEKLSPAARLRSLSFKRPRSSLS